MNLTAQSVESGFLGKVAVVPDSEPICILNQRIARLIGVDVAPRFLFWALRSPTVRTQISRRGQGTKVQHLYDDDLRSLEFALPTEKSDQLRAVEPLWAAVTRLETERRLLDGMKQSRVGLAADLLSGRVGTISA